MIKRLAGAWVLIVLSLILQTSSASAQDLKVGVAPIEPTDIAGSAPESVAPNAHELGLIEANTYASPQFGTVVTWVAPWEADLASMETDSTNALDRLSIVTDSARFQAFFILAQGETPEEYASRFIEFRLNDDPTIKIVESGTIRGVYWIGYTYAAQGGIVQDIVEISLVGDSNTIQVVEIIGWPEEFNDSFDDAMDKIDVNGGAPFLVTDGWPESGTNSTLIA